MYGRFILSLASCYGHDFEESLQNSLRKTPPLKKTLLGNTSFKVWNIAADL